MNNFNVVTLSNPSSTEPYTKLLTSAHYISSSEIYFFAEVNSATSHILKVNPRTPSANFYLVTSKSDLADAFSPFSITSAYFHSGQIFLLGSISTHSGFLALDESSLAYDAGNSFKMVSGGAAAPQKMGIDV